MPDVRIKVVRKFVPHAMLLGAASNAIASAKAKSEGYWWDWLGAILYCSLSIEAIGNTYGETLIGRWQDFESASPLAKIRLVAEHCGLQPDFSIRPWQIVRDLIRFRNLVAHAKPEQVLVDAVHRHEDYERYLYAKPESKIEKVVTAHFAQQSYDCVREILRLLATGLPAGDVIKIETESWHGSAEPAIKGT
jgi:hypothetical protein